MNKTACFAMAGTAALITLGTVGCDKKAEAPAPAPAAEAVPAAPAPQPDTALEIDVFTSPEAAGAVNSTLLIGTSEVVVIDAQFTKSAAEAVADRVTATGKSLTAVFITHAHPDHYLGTAVLAKRFPKARFVATPDVVAAMKASATAVAEARKDMLGPEFPGMPIIPEPVDSLAVDGVEIELMPGIQGDADPITVAYVRDQGTLIASDVAYADVHLWTATTDDDARVRWSEAATKLAALPGLERVIPGHQLASSKQTPAVFASTRQYIEAFNAAAAKADSAEELAKAMTSGEYEALAGRLFLDLGVQARYAAEGE